MDPYLESPSVWPDFHEAFLAYLRETLQPILPAGYYATLKTREELGILGHSEAPVVFPDLSVKTTGVDAPAYAQPRPATGLEATTPEHIVVAELYPMRVSFLEIREARGDECLVTVMELLSPSNKLPGADRDAFERKQRDVLSSGIHWVEIDLLRSGKRVGCHATVDTYCRRKAYDYVVVVSRSSRRSPRMDLELYGFGVRSSFPAVSIPLREPDPDVVLDLGASFRRAYETGPYSKMIRYDLPPDPPLSGNDSDWAVERVAIARGGA